LPATGGCISRCRFLGRLILVAIAALAGTASSAPAATATSTSTLALSLTTAGATILGWLLLLRCLLLVFCRLLLLRSFAFPGFNRIGGRTPRLALALATALLAAFTTAS